MTFTYQTKKRIIYSYDEMSVENILCQYIKKQIDHTFHIKYKSRKQIINYLFNTLPLVKDLKDFVIIRTDFKSFFDTIKPDYIYEKYLKESIIPRRDKEYIKQYTNQFKYCFAGLCLSNVLAEIICQDFDQLLQARLDSYGVVFYERYVDDMLLILNTNITKASFLSLLNSVIKEVFESCPVKLNSKKFNYISKREISLSQNFDFLGYNFTLNHSVNNKNKSKIDFLFGMAPHKLKRYKGIFMQAFLQYKKDGNLELLRHRIKIYSSRVVVGRKIGEDKYEWSLRGLVGNYNELRHHLESIDNATEVFLKDIYFKILSELHITTPYFLKQSKTESSVYNVYSCLERNRSIVFDESIGMRKIDLIQTINKLSPHYNHYGKSYFQIVMEYFSIIKIE